MTPEALAERILIAAGSGLRHYAPQSKERILQAAEACLRDIIEEAKK